MTMHPDQDDVTTQAAVDAPGNDATIETDELVEQLRGELEQLRARSLIEQADLENQRKRLERDVRNACRFANKQLLGDLLPVFDSLEAALASAPDADPMRDGVVLILRSEERRVVKECVSTCRLWGSPSHYKKKQNREHLYQ